MFFDNFINSAKFLGSGMNRIMREHKEPWLKETLKKIKNLINNQTFLIEDQNEGEPVTPCMDVYKAKITLMEVLTS